jgi:plastocyanin
MNRLPASAALVAAIVTITAVLACGGGAKNPTPPAGASSDGPGTEGPAPGGAGSAGTGSAGAASAGPASTGPDMAGAVADGAAIGSAVLAGRVRFAGTAPPRRPIRMSAEAACHRPGADPALAEDLIVNPDGTLSNVWVRVIAGLGHRTFAPPATAAEVDQKGCLFAPHVLMARTGQPILFRNSDPVLHNINTLARLNHGFNLSLPTPGMSVTRSFAKAEAVRIKCDVHTWMAAWIVVNDNPFQALTGDDGTFELSGLPEGAYEIEAWHETLGTARQVVNVAEGERRDIEFSFSRPDR